MIRFIASIIALTTALGGYISWKYSTTSVCEAARQATIAELPRAVDDLADQDPRFRALRVGQALLGGGEGVVQGVAAELVTAELEDASAAACAVVVARRELTPSAFRADLAQQLSERADRLLR